MSISSSKLIHQATCAVLINGEIKGTAWLVTKKGHLLTAGHVLGKNAPVSKVEVRFEEDIPREAYKIQWDYQPQTGTDFAVLMLASAPPHVRPLPISLAKEVAGDFRLCGYGVTLQDRSEGMGIFVGLFDPQDFSGNRLFRLRSPETGEVGYSGAAVFSEELQAVVAIQIEAATAKVGAGRDTLYFIERGLEVQGIELAQVFIDTLRRKVNIPLYKMDMRHLDFPDNTFDGIWCCSAFLHLLRSDALSTLKEFYRVLKPGGVLYVDLKEGEGEKWVISPDGHVTDIPRFFTYYHLDEICSLYTRAGFTVEYTRKQPHPKYAHKHTWLNVIGCKLPTQNAIS